MWIDPEDGDRMAVAHDGGVSISENRGRRLVQDAAAARSDVPRHGGQRDSLQRPRQPAGWPLDAGAEPRVHRRLSRRRHPPGDVARRGRRRERLRHAGPRRSRHRLVERLRFRRRRRNRRPLQRKGAAVPPRRGVARTDDGLAGGGSALPVPVGLPAAHLSPRPQHGLRGKPARAPDHGRRPELGGNQPRSDHERQDPAGRSPAASPRTTSAWSTAA